MFKEKKLKAVKIIEKYSKEGDIININGKSSDKLLELGYWGIRKAQKLLIGTDGVKYGNDIIYPYQDTHTMIKFKNSTIKKYIGNNSKVRKILQDKPMGKTFSVEPPYATLLDSWTYCLDDLTFWRYTKKEFDESDISVMLHATLPILLTKYDYGQLLNIGINQILGYSFEEKVKWFDFGSKYKVCSVGAGVVYQKWRQVLELRGIEVPRLFSKLNPQYWSKDFIKKFKDNNNHWNVENYYPCLFSCSERFDNEFKLILHIKNGNILYQDGI